LLNANFIYSVFDSKWASPLVIVPMKSGKWIICVYYHDLNEANLKYYFSLPFIDQDLDTLVGKKFFLFSGWVQWIQLDSSGP